MILEMYIGDILIMEREIQFPLGISLEEKEEALKEIAQKMYKKHWRNIRRSGVEPKFFIRVESRMNYENVES